MSLPIECRSPSEYFLKTLKFLRKYSWIYKTSNTCFIKEDVVSQFPQEWISYFLNISNRNLNLFPENLNTDIPPGSIKEFQNEINLLKPSLEKLNIKTINATDMNLRKVNFKKTHEISALASLILELCKEIDIFVDFGSGLGYLGEFLYKINNEIKVLGLESDSNRVLTSTKRMREYYPSAARNIYFLEHHITESSDIIIKKSIKKYFPGLENPKICIIGLHSCADLTIFSINIFLKNPQIRKLIIMPCCYHKLEILENVDNAVNNISFKNFPLSNCLKHLAANFEYCDFFNRPFLRLASQQTASKWREMNVVDHLNHGQEMFIRGILEAVRKENEMVKKKNRKCSYLDADITTIKSIYEIHLKNSPIVSEWTKERELQIQKLLSKYSDGGKIAEALTCLQTSIQGICENLVLFDRICFINEESQLQNLNIKSCFQKLFDDKLSPRCFVLIAEKDNN